MTQGVPGWYPDPMMRFELRYHNGHTWTADVAADGQRYVDPLGTRPTAPQPTRPQPSPGARNPAATAAMTLGIVAVVIGWLPVIVVFGAIAAVLAIVFGVIGRRRARDRGVGHGAAVTGLVTGGAGLAVAVVGVLFTLAVFRAFDRFADPAAHAAVITGCTRVGDDVTAQGELTNLDDRAAHFSVRIFFVRPGTDNPRRAALVELGRVPAGVTAPFEVTRPVGTDPIDCIIDSVRGPLPYGIDPGT